MRTDLQTSSTLILILMHLVLGAMRKMKPLNQAAVQGRRATQLSSSFTS